MSVEIHSFETTVKGSVIQFHSISYATIAIENTLLQATILLDETDIADLI
jgi:hypothetical protein